VLIRVPAGRVSSGPVAAMSRYVASAFDGNKAAQPSPVVAGDDAASDQQPLPSHGIVRSTRPFASHTMVVSLAHVVVPASHSLRTNVARTTSMPSSEISHSAAFAHEATSQPAKRESAAARACSVTRAPTGYVSSQSPSVPQAMPPASPAVAATLTTSPD